MVNLTPRFTTKIITGMEMEKIPIIIPVIISLLNSLQDNNYCREMQEVIVVRPMNLYFCDLFIAVSVV